MIGSPDARSASLNPLAARSRAPRPTPSSACSHRVGESRPHGARRRGHPGSDRDRRRRPVRERAAPARRHATRARPSTRRRPRSKLKTVNWPLYGYNRAPHPLSGGEGDKAAVQEALEVRRQAAARVPADLRRTESSSGSTTTATRSRSTPTTARCSGSAASARSTLPHRPTRATGFSSSTSSPARCWR